MTPDDIGRLVIAVMSGVGALIFAAMLTFTRKGQDIHRIVMWVGFGVLCVGNYLRNLAAGNWIPDIAQVPSMALQIAGLTCLIIAGVEHLRRYHRSVTSAQQRRQIDADIASHR